MGVETVWLETLDGVSIEADLIRTDAERPAAFVVIGHPHPLHGGDKHNHVVRALQQAAADLMCHSVAIDFRGTGNSGGIHDDGDAERLDLAAACELAELVDDDCPIIMAGYSFGALVGLNVSNPWIAAWLSVAPPLSMTTSTPIAAANPRPKMVVAAEHDQFTPTPAMRDATKDWKNTVVMEVASVDHFFAVGAHDACVTALRGLIAAL